MTAPPLDRSQFPVTERLCYLNHAGTGPLSRPARDVAVRFLDDVMTRGAIGFYEWDEQKDAARATAATLLGAGVSPDDVAFVKNTTEGLAFVANGLSWSPGDRVLVPDLEFPSTIYPWLALRDRGVEVDRVAPVGDGWELPLDRFAAELARRPTRLVALSWVSYGRGYRVDLAGLAALCHDHGALLCVDIIQGLGVVPVELAAWGVDFAAADARKWLLGPAGCGLFYVAPGQRDRLRPLEPGWASGVPEPDWEHRDLVLADSARRFEGGIVSTELVLQMGASIALLLDAGVDRIQHHVAGLLQHARGALAELGAEMLTVAEPGHSAGSLTFTVPGHEPGALVTGLARAGIVGAPRGGGIRISPHGYTTLDEIDHLVATVRTQLGR